MLQKNSNIDCDAEDEKNSFVTRLLFIGSKYKYLNYTYRPPGVWATAQDCVPCKSHLHVGKLQNHS